MNLVFHGTAKALWMAGLAVILISALVTMVTGNSNSTFPLVVIGFALIVAAFVVRRKSSRG